MKRKLILLLSLLCGLAFGPAARHNVDAAVTVHYMAVGGSDTNPGTSAAPWLTPNHPLNCGDTIIAKASSSYDYHNLNGTWGNVSCPQGNNVAWLTCESFLGCRVIVPDGVSYNAVGITQSYWGMQGWYASNLMSNYNGNPGGCFEVTPGQTPVHHIIFANDYAQTCPLSAFGGGYEFSHNPPTSVDYIAIVGVIAYGGGNISPQCGSNIGMYGPMNLDNKPGTHMYVAGSFSFASFNPNTTSCYDGNGIIWPDTADGGGTGAKIPPYTGQIVIQNNIANDNGGVGIRMEYNNSYTDPSFNGLPFAPIVADHNTAWGNGKGTYVAGGATGGEIQTQNDTNTVIQWNLAVASAANLYLTGNPNPGIQIFDSDTTVLAKNNWIYSSYQTASGNAYPNAVNFDNSYHGSGTQATTAQFTANTVGTDPQFANPTVTPAPNVDSCAAAGSVPACMAQVVANFTPTNPAAKPYGYQKPSSVAKYDPLFPEWLCHVNMPAGLITRGCRVLGGSTALGML